MNVEITKQNDVFITHPDGGHCNIVGMTPGCYGCGYYGGGLINNCLDRVKKLKEWICKEYKIPYDFMFDKNGNNKNIITDTRFDDFIKKLKTGTA